MMIKKINLYASFLSLLLIFIYLDTSAYAQSCANSTQCTSQSRPYCVNHQCRECANHSHCRNASNRYNLCYYGSCITNECFNDSHCGAPNKCVLSSTNPDTRQCVEIECTDDSHCSGVNRKCKTSYNPTNNRCVECLQSSDCGQGESCFTYNNTCYVCMYNSQCSGEKNVCIRNPSKPKGECTVVQCLNDTHCGGVLKTCKVDSQNPRNNECVECKNDQQCTGINKKCLSNNKCGCSQNSDCPYRYMCDGKTKTCKTGMIQKEQMIDPKKIKKISPKQIDQTNIDPKTIDKGTLEPELTIPIDSKQTKPKKMSR